MSAGTRKLRTKFVQVLALLKEFGFSPGIYPASVYPAKDFKKLFRYDIGYRCHGGEPESSL